MIDDDALKNIEKLHQLKKDGVITEADFEAAKQRLLQGQQPSKARPAATQAGLADNDWQGWATLPLKRYADFTGRSSRKEFWIFLLACNLVTLALAIIAFIDTDSYYGLGVMGKFAVVLIALAMVGVAIPLLAAEVRRFHDQDRSGWFAALNLIPYIGPVIVLVFMLVEGTQGDNRFGSDPKRA